MTPTTSRTVHTPQDDATTPAGNSLPAGAPLPAAVVLENVQAGGKISIGTVTQTLTQIFTGEPPDQRAARQRRDMLQLVENTWIEGFLLPSLPHNRRLYLQIKDRPDLVDNRQWQEAVQMPAQPPAGLDPSADIVDVFRQSGQSLLIAGAPGSGKTTLLLIVAQAMLAAARANVQECIPVVLNLVSWPSRHDALDGWIVEELGQKYQLPALLAQKWLENDELLLLLDGLDEVQEGQRGPCVAAINEFRSRRFAPVAVCSRLDEYAALPARLRLREAVEVCPLSSEQIDDFLSRQNQADAELAELVRADEQLRELASAPLMLYVLSVAGSQAANEAAGPTPEPAVVQHAPWAPAQVAAVSAPDRSARLWATYIDAMFGRRSGRHPFAPNHTRQVLHWLAQQMQAHNQTIFLLEQMQPSLLASRRERLLYHGGVRLAGMLLFLIACPLLGVLAAVVNGAALEQGLTGGVAVGLALAASLLFGSIVGYWLPGWAAVPIAAGLAGVCAGVLVGNMMEGPLWGLIFGLPGSLAGVALAGRQRLQTAEPFVWSLPRLILGLALGLAAALLIGLIVSLQVGLVSGLSNSLSIAISLAPVLAIVLGLTKAKTVQPTIAPNRGIRSSLHNSLRLFGLVALSSGIAAVSWGMIVEGKSPTVGLAYGLIVALPLSLIVMLAGGGGVILQHYLLRGVLAAGGMTPWRFPSFLNYAAERVLLRRVGGGYMFYHRSLMEYFAAMEEGGSDLE